MSDHITVRVAVWGLVLFVVVWWSVTSTHIRLVTPWSEIVVGGLMYGSYRWGRGRR